MAEEKGDKEEGTHLPQLSYAHAILQSSIAVATLLVCLLCQSFVL